MNTELRVHFAVSTTKRFGKESALPLFSEPFRDFSICVVQSKETRTNPSEDGWSRCEPTILQIQSQRSTNRCRANHSN